MNSFSILFSPLMLLLSGHSVGNDDIRDDFRDDFRSESWQAESAQQVRIEHQMTIRISPHSRMQDRSDLISQLPRQEVSAHFVERKSGNCVPAMAISGVQVGQGSRLILFMRDQRIFSVDLENSCRSRDFYSGFYIERKSDGQLCASRDKLQSRTGANCKISRMRQLVAVRD
ncbi:MAG: hypothetical protein ACK5NN_07205 [Sphingomonadaceae bacterium]